jgi:predicted  nucleic acid-binding Zn-ribbon protein
MLDAVASTSRLDKSRSPFKKRLEEKERLVNNLSRDLRVKTQELIKYEGVNNQLTERLRAFQSQNQENVKVAQVEINTLARELERSREAQLILEETVNGLRNELEDIYSRHEDLEQHSRHLIDIEERV